MPQAKTEAKDPAKAVVSRPAPTPNKGEEVVTKVDNGKTVVRTFN